ncbi:MAG: calcium-binding protein [Tepidisphaerales bacterium]
MRKMRGLPDVEMLEDRRLLAATMVGTVLHIDGTAGDDVITLSETKAKPATATAAATPATYNVKIGTDSTTFPKSLVSKIIIHGNAGNDKITVAALDPHPWILSIYGDDGNDTIVSADARDGIVGGAGDDFITGTGGHDTIQGGAGNDVIMGGGGNNRIYGQDGNDTLFAGPGNNTLSGGAGDDVIAGDSQFLAFAGQKAPKDAGGNDVLDGGDGNDWLLSGTGNAIIKGYTGKDTLTGGAGADVLDARGLSVVTDKNKPADGDFVPAQDYTPASNQPGLFHAKIKLTIKVKNGKKYDTVVIPAFIGYFNAATPADIRTKAADSIVYFDPPPGSTATWKLGDVFRMWGISFDSTHIGRYFAAPGRPLTLTIGGVKNTDFANAVLPVIGTTTTEVVITLG